MYVSYYFVSFLGIEHIVISLVYERCPLGLLFHTCTYKFLAKLVCSKSYRQTCLLLNGKNSTCSLDLFLFQLLELGWLQNYYIVYTVIKVWDKPLWWVQLCSLYLNRVKQPAKKWWDQCPTSPYVVLSIRYLMYTECRNYSKIHLQVINEARPIWEYLGSSTSKVAHLRIMNCSWVESQLIPACQSMITKLFFTLCTFVFIRFVYDGIQQNKKKK